MPSASLLLFDMYDACVLTSISTKPTHSHTHVKGNKFSALNVRNRIDDASKQACRIANRILALILTVALICQ